AARLKPGMERPPGIGCPGNCRPGCAAFGNAPLCGPTRGAALGDACFFLTASSSCCGVCATEWPTGPKPIASAARTPAAVAMGAMKDANVCRAARRMNRPRLLVLPPRGHVTMNVGQAPEVVERER